MTVETRFGQIEVTPEDVVTLHDGLIGFTALRQFVLISHNPESPFRWLQSLDDLSMAFLVVDPNSYVEGYAPEVSDEVAAELTLDGTTPALVYTTVSIPHGKPKEMTLNLAAPIIIHAASRVGKQVILDNEAYTMKHRVFEEEAREVETQAA